PWCAFVDPSGTLHAPGVVEVGVQLDHVLVVRPPLEALERTACRLARSIAFDLVIVDTVGVPGGVSAFPSTLGRERHASSRWRWRARTERWCCSRVWEQHGRSLCRSLSDSK